MDQFWSYRGFRCTCIDRWVPELFERMIIFDPVLLLVLLLFFIIFFGDEIDVVAVLFEIVALLREVLFWVWGFLNSFFFCDFYLFKTFLPALVCFNYVRHHLFLRFFVVALPFVFGQLFLDFVSILLYFLPAPDLKRNLIIFIGFFQLLLLSSQSLFHFLLLSLFSLFLLLQIVLVFLHLVLGFLLRDFKLNNFLFILLIRRNDDLLLYDRAYIFLWRSKIGRRGEIRWGHHRSTHAKVVRIGGLPWVHVIHWPIIVVRRIHTKRIWHPRIVVWKSIWIWSVWLHAHWIYRMIRHWALSFGLLGSFLLWSTRQW